MPAQERAQTTGWLAVLGWSLLAILVLVAAFFYVPQFLLTKVPSLARVTRAWLATAWTLGAFVAACVVGWRATRPQLAMLRKRVTPDNAADLGPEISTRESA